MKKPEISLRVPAMADYALVLRLALGGVAILKDLDAGTLDDLRSASDEACDCLLHQAKEAVWLELNVYDAGDSLTVTITAELAQEPADGAPCEDETELSRAVLETLIPVVRMHAADCGCVERIDLTLPKAAAVGA
ncbi:MAG: hypothetical protein E7327_02935 [Clostridiales bacterium]|nr:hypothetical protein [Clostridiales bacterium]